MKRSLYLLALLAVMAIPAAAALNVKTIKLRLVLGGTTGATTDRVAWEGNLSPADPTDVAFPDREDVTIGLARSDAFGNSVVFYAVRILAGGLSADATGFSLTQAGRSQSGLESLRFSRQTDGSWNVTLGDSRVLLPDVDYSTVDATLIIGDDAGAGRATLSRVGNNWTTN